MSFIAFVSPPLYDYFGICCFYIWTVPGGFSFGPAGRAISSVSLHKIIVMKATRDLIEDGLYRREGLVKGLVRAFRDW